MNLKKLNLQELSDKETAKVEGGVAPLVGALILGCLLIPVLTKG